MPKSGLLRPPWRLSLVWVLAGVVGVLTAASFLPLAFLSWSNYRQDQHRVEQEIQEANRHIGLLAASFLDTLLVELGREAELAERAEVLRLPPPTPGASWELVDAVGVVRASELAPARRGQECGYHEYLRELPAGRAVVSSVGRWLPELPPTVLVARRHVSDGGALAAILDPEDLHGRLRAWSGEGVDRHLYAVDGEGRLLFYSDLEVSERGDDLRANPPIERFLAGQVGALRYVSVVSGKERLGYVQALEQSDWAVVVSADAGARVLALKDRYAALALSILFAGSTALLLLLGSNRLLGAPLLEIVLSLRDPKRQAHAPLELRPSSRTIAEIDELVSAFDELGAEVAAIEQELVEAEKAALLGRLASGLAHEMGTPLNVISGNAEYLLRKTAAEDPAREVLQLVINQSERIAAMIRRLLDLSRPAPARLEELQAAEVVEQTLQMLPGINRGVEVVTRFDAQVPPVMADPKLLEHALLNLFVNACQAMPEGGRLTVTVCVLAGPVARGTTRWVAIEVEDTGVGIPEGELGRIFEPFFTTKPQGMGTGLGLAIVHRIVRQHGGEIVVDSRPGRGSVFSLRLRAAGADAGSATGRDHDG